MKGSETKLLRILDGSDKRFVIPVYQRSYSWGKKNCEQLYDDIKKVFEGERENHFFGSMVLAYSGNGSEQEALIIDGQQRLTTVSLMLIALCNYIENNNLQTKEKDLSKKIKGSYLTDQWNSGNVKLWLKKEDQKVYNSFFEESEISNNNSRILENYSFFYKKLETENVSPDDFFEAIKRLEIISITLDGTDNAQLIFESLNSTGLDLTEGDKVRNFIMMGIPIKKQDEYYEKYWEKIEQCTGKDTSKFIRDYLSLKQSERPNESEIYYRFKKYYIATDNDEDHTIMDDMLYYAQIYEKIITKKSGSGDAKVDNCLERLDKLDMTLMRPFLMRVLDLKINEKLDNSDLLLILETIESYILRRFICGVPTNSLNKFFVGLDKEISKYTENNYSYVKVFSYVLSSKTGNARFPKDDEFSDALSVVPLYEKSRKYQIYILDRFENEDTIETKDIYKHIEAGDYSIEHIMPQNLTDEWKKALGDNAKEIHTEWLHRLANLTLTGYNSELQDKPFLEKRDAESGGYKSSGLRLNQFLGSKDKWDFKELQERNSLLISKAINIWQYPTTDFKPEGKEYESYDLDDESVDYKGRDLVKYIFQNEEEQNVNWTEMATAVIKKLHEKDKSVLYDLVKNENDYDQLKFLSGDETKFRNYSEIDEKLFLDTNNNTNTKINILRKIFGLFDEDTTELTFFIN